MSQVTQLRPKRLLQKSNPLDGIAIHSAATVGRYSKLETIALSLQARHGCVEGFDRLLSFSPAELLSLYYEPTFTLRPVQRPPDTDWRRFLFVGGRGSGKTFGGATWVVEQARVDPDARGIIVGPTYSEIEKNQVLGDSGIIARCPPWFQPHYKKSKHQLFWPNGAQVAFVPAQNPMKFRGYNASFEWLDEIVAYEKNPEDVWKEANRIMRVVTPRMRKLKLGARQYISTTPAPTPLFKLVLEDAEGLVVAQSSTFENAVNLDPKYIRYAKRLMHTKEGKREFLGELAFELDPALFKNVDWAATRVSEVLPRPGFEGEPIYDLVVVSIDPATGEKKSNRPDEHGIIAMGIRTEDDGLDHTYILGDYSMRSPAPSDWAKAAITAFKDIQSMGKRGWIFAETNTGGSMVRQTIRNVDSTVRIKTERARNSKIDRAAPVSALCEAGLVHMVGRHWKLENQLSKFTGQAGGHARDDRCDAMIWPIWKYIARRKKNRGVLAELAEVDGDADTSIEEEEEDED